MANKKDPEKEYSANWGGKRSGGGRPKGGHNAGERKDKRIVLVCTQTEYDAIKEKASAQDKTVTKFILDTVLNR